MPIPSVDRLRDWLLEKFFLAVARDLDKDIEEYRTLKPHVTGLVYDCLRRCYYSLTVPEQIIDPAGTIKTWVGRKLHETPVLGDKALVELRLEYQGVTGKVDEYLEGFLLEKKTTRSIPRRGPREHHVRQVEYYRVLLERNGYPVKSAAILYVDVAAGELEVYPVEFERDLPEVEMEMLDKARVIKECLESGILPPRRITTWEPGSRTLVCSYCPYFGLCIREDLIDTRWRRGAEQCAGEKTAG